MKLYIDEDSVAAHLVRQLRREGHDVITTLELGLAGREDPEQLTTSIQLAHSLLTANQHDFEMLHELVIASKGHHPGILVICRDNDPSRDMTVRGTVVAISKLVDSGLPLADQFIILNHWR